MDLTKFNFPETTGLDIAFPTFAADPQLLEEAKERGFMYGHTPYNKLFSSLFFKGGKVKFKTGIDPVFQEKAWRYCRAFMGSWEPKHEHKEAIAALIMSEILEPELEKEEKIA